MYYRYRRQVRALLALLVLAVLAYGGLKAWLHYKVSRAIETVAIDAAGRADIQYGSIDTTLGGVVWVHDIAILPQGSPVPVHIGAARLSGLGLKRLALGWDDGDPPPPHLRLDLMGAEVALDPALIDALEQDLPGGAAQACAPGAGIDPTILRELGMERLAMDMSLAYDYNVADRRLAARFEFAIDRIERVASELTLDDVDPKSLQRAAAPPSLPALAALTLDMRVEPDFGKRYMAACAARRGQDVDTYRAGLVNQGLADLSRAGVQLGAGLRQAMATYHRDWGDLKVVLAPPTPLNPLQLLFGQHDDWQQVLGARVTVNGSPVTDLGFELRPADADELAIMLGEEPPPRPAAPRVRYRYVYRVEPVSALPRYVGAEVRLHMADGQPQREGVLVAVEGGEARVEQRLFGGKITAHVKRDEIRRLEVREVEQVPAR